jgi:hypothetical protein
MILRNARGRAHPPYGKISPIEVPQMLKATFSLAVLIIAGIFAAGGPPNQDPKPKEQVFRSPVKLLAGYKIQFAAHSFEGEVSAKIWKEGGLTIRFLNDLQSARVLEPADHSDVLWRQEQTINGHAVVCIYTKSQELLISFPGLIGHFSAKITGQQDIADMLLMVLTYNERSEWYPIDPSAIAPPARTGGPALE